MSVDCLIVIKTAAVHDETLHFPDWILTSQSRPRPYSYVNHFGQGRLIGFLSTVTTVQSGIARPHDGNNRFQQTSFFNDSLTQLTRLEENPFQLLRLLLF